MAREMVMCRACGEFVMALQSGGEIKPLEDECPECGDTEFKHNGTGRVIELD